MARPKNQAARRAEIIAAAKRAIAERGLTGLRLKDVAARTELTAGAIAYYYPDLAGLIRDVHQDALERFYWARKHKAANDENPRAALRHLIEDGVPASVRDIDFQVLNELHVHAFRDEFHARLMADLFDREVSLYIEILERGAAAGDFELPLPAVAVARLLVALEDASGLYLLGGTHLTRAEMRDLILSNAAILTGAEVASASAATG